MNNTTPTSLEAILRRFYMNKRADQALPEAIAAIQALIPEKYTDSEIELMLPNSQVKAMEHNRTIDTIQRNFTGQTDDGKEQ